MEWSMSSKTEKFGTPTRMAHDSSDFYKRKMYKKKPKGGNGVDVAENKPDKVDVIYKWDSRDMKQLPDNSVHLMITSPPYNVGKDYDDDLSLKEYLRLIEDVMRETYRVLVDGGRICVNIANVGRKPYIPMHAYITSVIIDCGFLMRGEIIWDKGASAGVSCAWGSWKSASNPCLRDVHEYILVFSKGSYSRYPIGKNTVDRDDFIENSKSIWKMVTASAKKQQHPAPFPVELPLRLIHMYSFKDDVILDPFIGSGTTAIAALQSDRRYVGYDIEKKYVDIANDKLKAEKNKLEKAEKKLLQKKAKPKEVKLDAESMRPPPVAMIAVKKRKIYKKRRYA